MFLENAFRRRALPSIALCVTALGLATLGSPATARAASTTFYIATTGSDTNAGTSASSPFLTIQKCASVAVAGDTCQIASGIYRETVTPAHSGTASAPITFTAAPGARVTVDGTDAVTGWALDSGHVYKTAVTLAGSATSTYSSTEYPANTDLWANQLFTGSEGTSVPEAAYPAPDADPFTQAFITSGWSSTRSASTSCTTPPCTTTLTGTLTYNSFPAFGDMTGAVADFAGGWVALSANITGGSLTSSNHTLNISFPASDSKVYPGGGNDNEFRLVGKRAFLTAPNEWFYDAAAHELYMWAANGAVPTNIYAKKRNYGLVLDSRSYIDVTNIGLFGTTITMNASSSHNVLNSVNSKYLSQFQTAQYDTSLYAAGIYDANHRFDSGILLHGVDNTLENSTLQQSAGNGVNIDGTGNTVHNDLIHDVGYSGTYTAAVTLQAGSTGATITNNTLYNTGRDVINMDTNLYPNAGYKDMRIAYNNIYGYAQIAFDLGGIYACCDDALTGTRIDHNVIHDPANTGNGIHLDNGTYDVQIDHNVIYGLKGNGDINHGGNGINFGGHTNAPPAGSKLPYLTGTIENNTIVAGLNDTIFNYFASSSYDANTVVKNNILDGAHPSGQDYGFISGGTPVEATNLVTLHSDNGTGTDPKYANPATGDYTLAAGSPAIDAGTVLPGVTDGYAGSKPDIGAYESGTTKWVAGCDWTGCF
jgi:hypothetical protein